MSKIKVMLINLKCKRCGHKWTPRRQEIKMCPKCKTIHWDRKRKRVRQPSGGRK